MCFADTGNIQTDSAAKYASQAKKVARNGAKTAIAIMDKIGFRREIKCTKIVHYTHRPLQFNESNSFTLHC